MDGTRTIPARSRFYLILFICFSLLPLVSGCGILKNEFQRYKHPLGVEIYYSASSEPRGAEIWEGDINHGRYYVHKVTEEDVENGTITIPKFTFRKEGYLPYETQPAKIRLFDIEFDPESSKSYWENTDVIILAEDPAFHKLETPPNEIVLVVSSEPTGARVYENDRLIGLTPFTCYYTLKPIHYDNEKLTVAPMVAAKDGYLPKERQLVFHINPTWRRLQGKRIEKATLFILERDPQYKE